MFCNVAGDISPLALYRYHFEEVLLPCLDDLLPDRRCRFFFQQDGAPPHFGRNVRQLPRRSIGRRGPMEWPYRSPDLTPLDELFFGRTSNNRPQTLIVLQDNIRRACAEISPATLQNTRRSFYRRVQLCFLQDGI